MSEPNYGPSRVVIRKSTDEMAERATDNLVAGNKFDRVWAEIRAKHAKGLNWITVCRHTLIGQDNKCTDCGQVPPWKTNEQES